MSGHLPISDEFLSLLNDALDDTLIETQVHELVALLDSDSEVRKAYIDHMQLRRHFRSLYRAERACDGGLARVQATLPGAAPPFSLLSTTLHGTVGFFSSGWPVAYMIATVICGVGMLIGSLVHVSEPAQVARQSSTPGRAVTEPKMEVVGRITGMVDCKWAGTAFDSPGVPLGRKYELASGLMEITYDTGAKVILQGPVTYEVESKDGGYLSLGRLTAKLEKKAEGSNPQSLIPNPSLSTIHDPLFTIKTPTATVTDLGTEFGVEVGKGDKVEVHVLQGTVTVQQSAHKDGTPKPMRVTQGQAVQIEPNRAVFTAVAYMPSAFVRSIGARRDGNSSPRLGGAYSRAVLSDHPVAYYRLNETAGHTAYDMANASGGRASGTSTQSM